jgi:D-3-phosphoglycerate dehydrogenase
VTNTITIVDCDFGRGEIERDILAAKGYDLVVGDATTEDDVIAIAGDSVGIITQYAPITGRVIDHVPSIRAVVRYGVGLDVIDLDDMEKRGVAVSAVTDYCYTEVADHTLSLILAIMRSVAQLDRATAAGLWPTVHQAANLETLTGKTVGLIGFGAIARQVAKRLAGFDCPVSVYDPFVTPEQAADHGVTLTDMAGALGQSVVSLHLPLTADTRHLINSDTLALMPKGSFLINVSRGGLIDEAALAASLDSGHLAGFAADVVDGDEPGNPLATRDNVIITPHVAYYSPESLIRLREHATHKLIELLSR